MNDGNTTLIVSEIFEIIELPGIPETDSEMNSVMSTIYCAGCEEDDAVASVFLLIHGNILT